MSLTEFFSIGLQLFDQYAPLWATIFVLVCLILGILLSLVILALSRV
jgi:hypothetical protein